MIPKEILEYLQTQQVGVLAVEMLDGSPHGATVHYAHTEEPFVFYFETYREYRKAEALVGRAESRASFVVGADEKTTKTLQLDGVIRLITPKEKETYDRVYFGKFPKKKEKSIDPKFLFFVFTPTWWRFTDFKAEGGKKILTSTTN
jgi:uncharacterized protein YhbP (UPF0306 family)